MLLGELEDSERLGFVFSLSAQGVFISLYICVFMVFVCFAYDDGFTSCSVITLLVVLLILVICTSSSLSLSFYYFCYHHIVFCRLEIVRPAERIYTQASVEISLSLRDVHSARRVMSRRPAAVMLLFCFSFWIRHRSSWPF